MCNFFIKGIAITVQGHIEWVKRGRWGGLSTLLKIISNIFLNISIYFSLKEQFLTELGRWAAVSLPPCLVYFILILWSIQGKYKINTCTSLLL